MSESNESGRGLEVGNVYIAKIIRSTPGIMGGDALAKIDDFTVSVSGSRLEEGEEVRVKITNVKGNTADGDLVPNASEMY